MMLVEEDVFTRMSNFHRPPPRLQLAPTVEHHVAHAAEPVHAVRFYEADGFLEREVAKFIAEGLAAGEAVVVVATAGHQRAFDHALLARGVDVAAAGEAGQLICVDADEMLSRLVVDGQIDAAAFDAHIVSAVNRARESFGVVRAFGEMVNLLWARDQRPAALALEELWTRFIHAQPFSLLCAYDLAGFRTEADCRAFEEVCHAHSRVLPSEWSDAADEDARDRTVARLLQRARALENEISQRRVLELERTTLLEQERRMRLRLDRLQQVSAALLEAPSADEVARVVVGQMAAVVQADQTVLVVRGDDGALTVAAHSGSADPRRAPLVDEAGWLCPQITEAASSLRPLWRDATVRDRAFACIPLVLRDRLLGVIAFAFNPPKAFSDDDRALAVDLGRQGAMALERARLYEQAQQAVKRRDSFLSIASHELKTPLTSVQLQLEGLLRLASEENRLTPQIAKQRLERVSTSVRRLSRLTHELLDVSKVTGSPVELKPGRVDLAALVREVVARFEEVAQRAACKLRIDAPAALVGEWDGDRLDQVISNLVSNAVRYASGEPVDVRVTSHQDRAVVVVQDHGEGISSEDQHRLFGQFERGTTVQHGGGLGMGLWLCRRIVEAHGGDIVLTSALGQGSTFEVSLPRRA